AGSETEKKRQVRWYITLTEDCNTVRYFISQFMSETE
ncbi:hypothetical protein SEEACDC4_01945, partial [Salmonella enterica subsp. enterica serovar Agona str. SA-4]